MDEFETVQTNSLLLLSEVRHAYRQSLDASHSGRPDVIQIVRTGGRGRPRVVIDPEFLRWAIAYRGSSAIARFLGCSRTTVRNTLLEQGILEPGRNPFSPTPPAKGASGHDQPEEAAAELEDDLANDPDTPPHLIPITR